MVLGEPHIIKTRPLGGNRRLHYRVEYLTVRLARELRRQQHPGLTAQAEADSEPSGEPAANSPRGSSAKPRPSPKPDIKPKPEKD